MSEPITPQHRLEMTVSHSLLTRVLSEWLDTLFAEPLGPVKIYGKAAPGGTAPSITATPMTEGASPSSLVLDAGDLIAALACGLEANGVFGMPAEIVSVAWDGQAAAVLATIDLLEVQPNEDA